MLIDVLQQYGFSEREAKVYLACLELWIAPASSIARRVDENRVTVYSVLKALKKRGIVYETQKKGTVRYGVIEPWQILAQEQQKLSKLEEKMPEFAALMQIAGNKPQVRFFEWIEGAKKAFSEVIEEKMTHPEQRFMVFTWNWDVNPEFHEYLYTEFIHLRKKCPIKSMMLIARDDKKYADKNKKFKDIRFTQAWLFGERNQVALYGEDKVGIYMYGEKDVFALVIQSKVFYSGLKWIFLHLRENAWH